MSDRLAFVERTNRRLTRAWDRGLLQRPSLDPKALIAKALRKERAGHIAPGEWQVPFAILTQDLRDRAGLNLLGEAMAHGQLVGILRQRIRIDRALAREPKIRDRPIPAPVVILGQMRSGTTRLHRLLACDRRFVACTAEEVMRPATGPLGRAERRAYALAVHAFLRRCNPALAAIHPAAPGDAEEEAGLQAISMLGAIFEAQWHVPNFTEYWQGADRVPAYRELKSQLQLLGHLRRSPADRTQLMKAPQYLADLDALLTVFPDARLIGIARDPVTAAASAASLVWNQRRIQSDTTDKRAIGAEWLAKTAAREAQAADTMARRNHPLAIDIAYDEVDRDWRGVVHRVWRALDMTPDLGAEQRMQRFLEQSRAHRGHRYDSDQFGIERARTSSAAV